MSGVKMPQVEIKVQCQTVIFHLVFSPWIDCAHTGAVYMESNLYKEECRRLVQFHVSPRAEEAVRLEGERLPGLILQDSTVKWSA